MGCEGGDGSPCTGPAVVATCSAEPELDVSIDAVVLYGPVMISATTVTPSWDGVLVTDGIQFLIKANDSNLLDSINLASDVALGNVGSSIITTSLVQDEEYRIYARRIRDGKVSLWTIDNIVWTGMDLEYILDGTAFVIDGAEDNFVIG